jgi:hypothetical protein
MKQFFFVAALSFALTAGTMTLLAFQLTRAAAQTLTFAVGSVTVLNGHSQPAMPVPPQFRLLIAR